MISPREMKTLHRRWNRDPTGGHAPITWLELVRGLNQIARRANGQWLPRVRPDPRHTAETLVAYEMFVED